MRAARIENSERLMRLLTELADGKEHSTLDLTLAARNCAVGTAIAELRANGIAIACRRDTDPVTGRTIWLYRLADNEEKSNALR